MIDTARRGLRTYSMLSFGLIAGAMLGFASDTVMGQTKDVPMKGLQKVTLLVEDLPAESAQCNVTKDGIESAFKMRLAGSPLAVLARDAGGKPDPQAATVYIKASTLQIDSGACVTSVSVRLYSYQKVVLAQTRREMFGSVELWEKGTMLATAKLGHPAAVAEAVTQKAQELITSWNLNNPSSPNLQDALEE